MTASATRYEWFALGDINGFFGLMFDNLTVLSFLAGTLILAFGFPADIVYTRMFPGTAFGVFVGDLVYAWMAVPAGEAAPATAAVTAMPLGLDTPSTIGMALVVLGPAFLGLKAEGMAERDAAMMTWYIGMATMVMIGVFKVICSFVGPWVQRAVPQAGPARIARRHRPRAHRPRAAGRRLRHAHHRAHVAGPRAVFARRAASGCRAISRACSSRSCSGTALYYLLGADRVDGRHLCGRRRLSIFTSACRYRRSTSWPA